MNKLIALLLLFSAAALAQTSNHVVCVGGTAGFSSTGAGVIAVGNCSAGDFSGTVKATSYLNAAGTALVANNAGASNQFVTAYNSTTGLFTLAQPSFSNLSGTATSAQLQASITLSGTPTAPTASAGDNTTQLATDAFVTAALPAVITDTGIASAYIITVPATALTSPVWPVKFVNANAGAATINVNSGGNVALNKAGAVALSTGDIRANSIYWVAKDGAQYQILPNPNVTAQVGATNQVASYTAGTAIGGQTKLTMTGGVFNVGVAGTQGTVQISGTTSGTFQITTAAAAGAIVATAPATTGASGTLGIYTAYTATLTPTAVAAATCADQTFTYTNLLTTDSIMWTTLPALGNVGIAGAWPSSANTLTIHFCNPTAGSVTPTSGTYAFKAVH